MKQLSFKWNEKIIITIIIFFLEKYFFPSKAITQEEKIILKNNNNIKQNWLSIISFKFYSFEQKKKKKTNKLSFKMCVYFKK